MIDKRNALDIINKLTPEKFEITERSDDIDIMYGIEHLIITEEDIEALWDGKILYSNNGEYAQIISYKERGDT